MKIGAIVILHYPDTECRQRIQKWAVDFSHLCIMDNSPNRWSEIDNLKLNIPNVEYFHDSINHGIAKALNTGINYLLEHGCEWAMTMDQDSAPPPLMHLELLRKAQYHPDFERFAIISPRHMTLNPPPIQNNDIQAELTLMTSGNILRISAWQKLGGFNENLFIDGVDDEFCLRANLENWLTVQLNSVKMEHPLGSQTRHHFLGRTYFPSNHSALRRYYITRNRIFLIIEFWNRHPNFRKTQIKNILRETFLIIVFEKNKFIKIYMTLLGIWHYSRKKMGILNP